MMMILLKVYAWNIFSLRHDTVMETECPDYLEHFRDDVRCKDYKEEGPEQ